MTGYSHAMDALHICSSKICLCEQVKQHFFGIIIGHGGAGKTTLVDHIAMYGCEYDTLIRVGYRDHEALKKWCSLKQSRMPEFKYHFFEKWEDAEPLVDEIKSALVIIDDPSDEFRTSKSLCTTRHRAVNVLITCRSVKQLSLEVWSWATFAASLDDNTTATEQYLAQYAPSLQLRKKLKSE